MSTHRPVSTAPHLDMEHEIAELRAEIAYLRARLAQNPNSDTKDGEWPSEITYGQQMRSLTQFAGISKDREAIGRTSEHHELPQPTRDQAQLEADFIRWGYCLVVDAMTPSQVDRLVERLLDQSEAEKTAGVAHVTHEGTTQFVPNLLPKGQVFRDLAALDEHAAAGAPLLETLLCKILGNDFYLATAHGSIVHQGGGIQELHQDQGFVPLPHPPYPLYSLVIWALSPFSLEEGATYVLPGSHRAPDGANLVHADIDFVEFAKGKLLALDMPVGSCAILDSRLLHAGGERTAPGTRLASRILYCRGMMRQQENLIACTDPIVDQLSPKLKRLIGYYSHYSLGMIEGNRIDPAKPKVPIGELSMSRPEEFEQDFDFRHTKFAEELAQDDWNVWVDYRGPNEE